MTVLVAEEYDNYFTASKSFDGFVPAEEANELLSWTAEECELTDSYGIVENKKSLRNSSTGEFLGVVSKKWTPVQPLQHLEFANVIVEELDATLDTVAQFNGGKQIVVTIKCPNMQAFFGNDDVVQAYLSIICNFTEGKSHQFYWGTHRFKCENELGFMRAASKRMVHSVNILDNIAGYIEGISETKKNVENFFDKCGFLCSVPLRTGSDVEEVLSTVYSNVYKGLGRRYVPTLPDNPTPREITAHNKFNDVRQDWSSLVTDPRNRSDDVVTWWSVYNAITDWLDHMYGRPSSRGATKFFSNLYGPINRVKATCFNDCVEAASALNQ